MKRLISLAMLGVLVGASTLFAGCNQAPTSDTPTTQETTDPSPAVTVTPVKVGTQEANATPPVKTASTAPTQEPSQPVSPAVAKTEPSQTSSGEAGTKSVPLAADVTPVTPPARPTVPPSTDPELQAKLKACENMIDLHALNREYRQAAAEDPSIKSALKIRESEILAKSPIIPISDALEVVGFDWETADPDAKAEQLVQHKITWLLRKTGEIKVPADRRAVLIVRGTVDGAHEKTVKKQKGQTTIERRVDLKIQDWKVGTIRTITSTLKAVTVPYEFQTWLAIETLPDAKNRQIERHGKVADLGWRADIGE